MIQILIVVLISVFVFSAADALGAPKNPQKLFEVKNTAELFKAMDKIGNIGGTIRLAPGIYELDKPIKYSGNHLNIVGSGWNTVLKRRGNGNAIEFSNSGFCTVKDLMIAGDTRATEGSGILYTGKCGSCAIDFCRIGDFAESGIRYQGIKEHPMSSNSVKYCHFIGNRTHQLHSVHNNDFYIIGNQFGTHSAIPKTGCWLDHSSAGTYTMNYHWGNTVAFRNGPGSHYNRIENNRFEESKETGVVIGAEKGDSSIFNIITGNTFHTNSKSKSGAFSAVEAYNASHTTFTSNQVFSWDSGCLKHKSSLVIGKGCSYWIVKDNHFRHNTEKSLVYDENANHLVKDNLTD